MSSRSSFRNYKKINLNVKDNGGDELYFKADFHYGRL